MVFTYRNQSLEVSTNISTKITIQVGISGCTAKSRYCKFVLSSHPGHFAEVASSRKSQTNVGTLACFDFFYKRMS